MAVNTIITVPQHCQKTIVMFKLEVKYEQCQTLMIHSLWETGL